MKLEKDEKESPNKGYGIKGENRKNIIFNNHDNSINDKLPK